MSSSRGRARTSASRASDAEVPPIDEGLVAEINDLPDVEIASGSVADETNTKIIGSDGKAINTNGAPSLGFGVETGPEVDRFNPLNLVEGAWATGPDEVVIDAGTADRENYKVGDTIQIATIQPKQDFKVTGIAKFGDVDSLGSATFAIFDLPTAQKLLDREGQVDSISVAGTQGTTPEQLIEEIQPVLPADAQVRSAQAEAQEDKDDISEFTNFIRYFLLAFAGIALFVGAFVIFNTLSITVAQRTREFATMRTVGASRRQILWSVIVEALAIGIVASVIGLFVGFGLAIGLNELFKALELDLPTANMVYATRTIVVSLLVGTTITLVAGLFPAIRATRVPPIAAVREGFTLPKSRLSPFVPYIALGLIGLALLLLGYSMFKDDLDTASRLLSIAGGVILLFIGVAMISSRLVRPLAALVGLPARAIGGAAGKLARGNSVRNPGRTASTAAALMIGIALVTFVAVLANGMKASNRGAIEDQVAADYVITAQDGFTPFVAAAGDAVASSPDAVVVANVRADLGKVGNASTYVTGIDPQTILQTYNFDWKEGDDSVVQNLTDEEAIVDAKFAEDNNIAVGDTISVLTPSGNDARAEGRRPVRAASLLPAARRRVRHDGEVRLGLRSPAEPVHVRERRGRLLRCDDGVARERGRRVSGREGSDARGLDHAAGRGLQPVPHHALRPSRPVRDREHLRHGQHARPLRLRAHARAGHAPRGRHDEAPGTSHGAARERDHRVDRRRTRPAARHLPGRARHPARSRSSTSASRSRGASSWSSRSSP